MKCYLIVVVDDIEPEVRGPFSSDEQRVESAQYLRKKDPEKKNGMFRLNISENCIPTIDSFGAGEVDNV